MTCPRHVVSTPIFSIYMLEDIEQKDFHHIFAVDVVLSLPYLTLG